MKGFILVLAICATVLFGIMAAVLLGIAALLFFVFDTFIAVIRYALIAVCAGVGIYLLYLFIRCLITSVNIIWTNIKPYRKERSIEKK